MTRYRWLSKAEARRRFPKDASARELVQDQTIKGVVTWTPEEWAMRMLELIDDPKYKCSRAMAEGYRAAEEAMRVEQ